MEGANGVAVALSVQVVQSMESTNPAGADKAAITLNAQVVLVALLLVQSVELNSVLWLLLQRVKGVARLST